MAKLSERDEAVLALLRKGPVCSQGFFHELQGNPHVTHRIADTIYRLRKSSLSISDEKCSHGRKRAVHYTLQVTNEQQSLLELVRMWEQESSEAPA